MGVISWKGFRPDCTLTDKKKQFKISKKENEVLSTTVSLDRVQKLVEESQKTLSSSSSEDEDDEPENKPKSAKSIRSRPRSASGNGPDYYRVLVN